MKTKQRAEESRRARSTFVHRRGSLKATQWPEIYMKSICFTP